jgi:hypothetical protein
MLSTPRRFPTMLALLACLALAACGGGSTATPGASAAASVQVSGDEVIDAFLEVVKDPGFTTETEMTATMTSSGIRIRVQAEGSLAGHDAQMTMRLSQGQIGFDLEMILLGDFAYVRALEGEWTEVDRDAVNTGGAQIDSFEFLTEPGDLEYDGTAMRGGERVHVLVNAGPIRYLGPSSAEGNVGLLEILVREDGTPISLSYRVEATTLDLNGVEIRAVGDVEQSFTSVGEPTTIEPPAGF